MDLKVLLIIFNGLLLISPICWAQGVFNYNTGNIPAAATAPIRQLTAGFAAGSTAAAAFPTAPSAFSGIGGVAASAAGPFGGFAAQNQRGLAGLAPSGATAYGGSLANIPKRTNLQQRPTGTGSTGSGSIYAPNTQFPSSATGRATGTGTSGSGLDEDYDGDFSAIPGVPGVDYPVYSLVPQTNFDCAQQPLPGYYSDIEAQCQVFHICALNRTYSFLCPNGTIFSQEVLVCVWWNQYDCSSAPSLYANNAFIYDYGNDRIPTNAGFQQTSGQQIARPQTNLLTSNAGRPATTSSNLFTSQRIQPSISGGVGGGGNIAVQPSSLTGVNANAVYNPVSANAGLFNAPTNNAGAQTFPGTPSPFRQVLRPGNPTNAPGGVGIGQSFNANVPENAGIATATTKNRDYLPPSARRQ